MNNFEVSLESSSWAAWLGCVSGAHAAPIPASDINLAHSPRDGIPKVESRNEILAIQPRPLSSQRPESAADHFVLQAAITCGIATVLSTGIYLGVVTLYGLWIAPC